MNGISVILIMKETEIQKQISIHFPCVPHSAENTFLTEMEQRDFLHLCLHGHNILDIGQGRLRPSYNVQVSYNHSHFGSLHIE